MQSYDTWKTTEPASPSDRGGTCQDCTCYQCGAVLGHLYGDYVDDRHYVEFPCSLYEDALCEECADYDRKVRSSIRRHRRYIERKTVALWSWVVQHSWT